MKIQVHKVFASGRMQEGVGPQRPILAQSFPTINFNHKKACRVANKPLAIKINCRKSLCLYWFDSFADPTTHESFMHQVCEVMKSPK